MRHRYCCPSTLKLENTMLIICYWSRLSLIAECTLLRENQMSSHTAITIVSVATKNTDRFYSMSFIRVAIGKKKFHWYNGEKKNTDSCCSSMLFWSSFSKRNSIQHRHDHCYFFHPHWISDYFNEDGSTLARPFFLVHSHGNRNIVFKTMESNGMSIKGFL